MEHNAVCTKCEKPIFADASKIRIKCPQCGKLINTAEAIASFESSFSTKNGELIGPKVGDSVFFGTYLIEKYKRLPIEWIVLDVKDEKALVISKYALEARSYNEIQVRVRWATCRLHEWLNNEFISSAFSNEEVAKIQTVTVSADKNPKYSTQPGKATKDKVFLLSINELETYFASDVAARRCKSTNAVNEDLFRYTAKLHESCWWWLRTPGCDQYTAAYVNNDGTVNFTGNNVRYSGGVRPAMWIEI